MNNILETICIRVTKHCNLSCSHCRAGSSPFEKEYLNISNFKSRLKELKSIGLKHISISGGEPLLIKNIGEFMSFLIDQQFEVSITTNGTIELEKTDLQEFIKKTDKIRFRFSIDGDKDLHESIRGKNTFEKTVRNLATYKEWNGWISLNTVVFKDTLSSISNLLKKLDLDKIDEWAFISPVIRGNGKSMVVDKSNYPALLNNAEEILRSGKFNGNIKKWDFINSPNASVLLNANGDFVLSGISIEDDVFVTNLNDDFDLERLKEIISEYEEKLDKAYFKSSRWSKKNYA